MDARAKLFHLLPLTSYLPPKVYMSHERRAHILRLLAERGSIRSAALAEEFGVTDETIRTDLVLLEREGQLRRRHGGAEFVPPPAKGQSTNDSRLDFQLASALLPQLAEGCRLVVDASRLCPTLLGLLRERALTLITHAPEWVLNFAAEALPHQLLCVGGEVDKASRRLCPPPDALAALAPEVAVLSPERVELRGSKVALGYRHRADRLWAQEVLAHCPTILLAFPSSAIAAWSGEALPCCPKLIVTEDNLPPGASPPHARLVPYLDPASLLPADDFDY